MSDFYNKYPYTDFHELNLDWVIERVKKLTEDWAATLEEWNSTEEQWQQLYDYVHDYFDNLDVQQEINNKINAMIADGTFVTITTPVIEAKVASMMPATVAAQIGDTVASQIGSTVASQIGNTVASQIDAAIVTPVNTWLSQHITQPTTPVVDTSLSIPGAAADAAVTGELLEEVSMGEGLDVSAIAGQRIVPLTRHILYKYSDGSTINSNTNYRSTGLIPTKGFDHIKTRYSQIALYCQIAYFDASGNYLQAVSHEGTGSNETIDEDIPATAAYVAFSRQGSDIFNVTMTSSAGNSLKFLQDSLDTADYYHMAQYGGVTSPPTDIVPATTRAYVDIKAPFRFSQIIPHYPNTLAITVEYVKISGSWTLVSNTPSGNIYDLPAGWEEFIICFKNALDGTVDITAAEMAATYIEVVNNQAADINRLDRDVSDIEYSYLARRANVMFGGWSIVDNDFYEADNDIRCKTYPIDVTVSGRHMMVTLPNTLIYNSVAIKDSGSWVTYSHSPVYPTEYFDFADTVTGVRFSFKHSDNSSIAQSEVDEVEVSYRQNEYFKQVLPISSWANGKTMACLGDSITYGYIPRNAPGYPGQLKSWAVLAAERLGMTLENDGIVGSTLAYDSDPGRYPMCRRFSSMTDNADIITVMGGTNDIRLGTISLGTMDDRTDATYYGALHIILGGLYKKYCIDQGTTDGKRKKIIAITPIKLLGASGGTDGGTGTLYPNFDQWAAAVKEVATYYSIPVLDFYNLSMINPHLNETLHGTEPGYTDWYNPYITDGTHPTQEGQQMMADVFVGFLNSLNY